MNYTYLPTHPFPQSSVLPSGPTIIMTTNPSSKKTSNLVSNPNVSLLVHDWVSSRPPATTSADRERSPTGGPRSSLAAMLMQMNSTAVSSISTTMNGQARVLDAGSEEEKWCKEQHLQNNTFDSDASGGEGAGGRAGVHTGTGFTEIYGSSPAQTRAVTGGSGDGGRERYIEDESVRVVVVKISDGRISDWKGAVKDWVIAESTGTTTQAGAGAGAPLVNGI
ncbi:uncharacterized protein K489DRAFT_384066 [Dissoconium aciculare CBS 342.82]|jgi:hypothetical protein|uniref:Pyridoxamine 5'-phosphate oxidase putative domain-containing protein n=1 Tax=Dissoconium aciculare CBS 342.82 TaxID=1314786 RepID=A0A6J3LV64_9PEZI|nr:uncharacterized protein K489DRAFT_384066 [Dissoconium aciculare CBS 342.82]KAF1819164.1 hypothetical protein K489DRAFT_384066 [Dissoconium aciculare CBS 342.82]